MKIFNIISVLILCVASRAIGSETNSLIGYWRATKMANLSGTTYFTNSDLMFFATNNLLTMRYRDLANGVAPQNVQCQNLLLSSNRLLMKFTEDALTTATISYSYTLSSNGLRLERMGQVERFDGRPTGPVIPLVDITNSYERVSGFTF
jgi:hypothetical protein